MAIGPDLPAGVAAKALCGRVPFDVIDDKEIQQAAIVIVEPTGGNRPGPFPSALLWR
jgi:hypothetical protein